MLGVPTGTDVLKRNLAELGTSGMQKLNNQHPNLGDVLQRDFRSLKNHVQRCSLKLCCENETLGSSVVPSLLEYLGASCAVLFSRRIYEWDVHAAECVEYRNKGNTKRSLDQYKHVNLRHMTEQQYVLYKNIHISKGAFQTRNTACFCGRGWRLYAKNKGEVKMSKGLTYRTVFALNWGI